MHAFHLTDDDARVFIYRAFLERAVRGVPRNLMPTVHDRYFSPIEDEFRPRTMWSLSNAFTSAFKSLAPTKQFEVTARLGSYLTDAPGIGVAAAPDQLTIEKSGNAHDVDRD